MSFPLTHPVWMWLYFGAFGTAGLILFTLIAWNGMKLHAQVDGPAQAIARRAN